MRYLPAGYIFDSGAPCAFLRPGVEHDELFFILGWSLTDLCTTILKEVLNHTRNIQSKDFERLPYPAWVSARSKRKAVVAVKGLLARAKNGEVFSFKSPEVRDLNTLYEWEGSSQIPAPRKKPLQRTFQLRTRSPRIMFTSKRLPAGRSPPSCVFPSRPPTGNRTTAGYQRPNGTPAKMFSLAGLFDQLIDRSGPSRGRQTP